MGQLLSKTEVRQAFDMPSWQRMVFSEFASTLESKSRPFPCVFGVSGFKSDQLRYGFLDPISPIAVAPLLEAYLAQARDIGRMTSLVLFSRPGPVLNIEAYRQQFWTLLDELSSMDTGGQPKGISNRLDDPSWEFSFAGEPIFVVCNTPAHVLRQSRRSTSFMVTFQPRWVFDGITDSEDPAVLRALASVRKHLTNFDAIAPAPYLGTYGDLNNREYQQYFIDDTNAAPVCPFHALGNARKEDSDSTGKVA